MAIENPPFIADVPFKTPIDFGDFRDFPSHVMTPDGNSHCTHKSPDFDHSY